MQQHSIQTYSQHRRGWELCSVGDVYVGENDTVNVYVRKAVAYKNIIVNYVLEDGSQFFLRILL